MIKDKIRSALSNKLLVPLAFIALAASAVTGVVGVADAAGTTSSTGTTQWGTQSSSQLNGSGTHTPPAAVGTVTAVSGDTITLTDAKTSTTYTVDATNATITKHTKSTTAGVKPTSTTISVSQVAVGDMLAVQGTVSGDAITATKIDDGMFGGGHGKGPGGDHGPGVVGTVTAVNGDTLTVTGKNGTTYTVDATNSTIGKMETISVSNIQVGDTIGVQGTVSGDSVTAKSIMDGIMTPPAGAPDAGASASATTN